MRINSGTAHTARARTLLVGIAVLLVATLGQVTGTSAGANQSTLSTATGAIRIDGSEPGRTFDGSDFEKPLTHHEGSWQPGYEPGLAIDGDPSTFWQVTEMSRVMDR